MTGTSNRACKTFAFQSGFFMVLEMSYSLIGEKRKIFPDYYTADRKDLYHYSWPIQFCPLPFAAVCHVLSRGIHALTWACFYVVERWSPCSVSMGGGASRFIIETSGHLMAMPGSNGFRQERNRKLDTNGSCYYQFLNVKTAKGFRTEDYGRPFSVLVYSPLMKRDFCVWHINCYIAL